MVVSYQYQRGRRVEVPPCLGSGRKVLAGPSDSAAKKGGGVRGGDKGNTVLISGIVLSKKGGRIQQELPRMPRTVRRYPAPEGGLDGA